MTQLTAEQKARNKHFQDAYRYSAINRIREASESIDLHKKINGNIDDVEDVLNVEIKKLLREHG